MKSPHSEASTSPNVHSENIQRELSKLIDHLEADTRRVDDRRFRGLLEKSAEVLKGLRTLFARFGRVEGEHRDKDTTPATRSKKDDVRNRPTAIKASSKRSPASSKSDTAARVVDGKEKNSTSKARAAKPAPSSQMNESVTQTPHRATTVETVPTVPTPKPPDPLAIAAKAQQQRKEARAPQRPGGHSAPRPVPPRSGKPVWSKPHSS